MFSLRQLIIAFCLLITITTAKQIIVDYDDSNTFSLTVENNNYHYNEEEEEEWHQHEGNSARLGGKKKKAPKNDAPKLPPSRPIKNAPQLPKKIPKIPTTSRGERLSPYFLMANLATVIATSAGKGLGEGILKDIKRYDMFVGENNPNYCRRQSFGTRDMKLGNFFLSLSDIQGDKTYKDFAIKFAKGTVNTDIVFDPYLHLFTDPSSTFSLLPYLRQGHIGSTLHLVWVEGIIHQLGITDISIGTNKDRDRKWSVEIYKHSDGYISITHKSPQQLAFNDKYDTIEMGGGRIVLAKVDVTVTILLDTNQKIALPYYSVEFYEFEKTFMEVSDAARLFFDELANDKFVLANDHTFLNQLRFKGKCSTYNGEEVYGLYQYKFHI